MSGPLSERSCYQPNIPEETRRAAYVAFDEASDLDWQKRAVDAALHAAAPFLVAAERQRLHDRIEALCAEYAAWEGHNDTMTLVLRDLRALVSPVSDDTGGES